MLCGSAFRRAPEQVSNYFEELRELCRLTGDKASLAIGMTGLMSEHMLHARVREASQLASEQMALIESIGVPTLRTSTAVGALVVRYETVAIAIRYETGGMADILRWSQTVLDCEGGDPGTGNIFGGSPQAVALAWRGVARWWLGEPGWGKDLDDAVAIAQSTDPVTHAAVVSWKYRYAIVNGVLQVDDLAVGQLEAVLRLVEGFSDDYTVGGLKYALGVALVHRDAEADRQRGLDLLLQVREMCLHQRFFMSELPEVDLFAARETARRGDRDGAIPVMQKSVDDLFNRGQLAYCVAATGVLVETLLYCAADGDIAEAQSAIDRLTDLTTPECWVVRDITLLRLRALLAQAHGDETAYRDYRDRYRAMATELGFEGHMQWAEAMP